MKTCRVGKRIGSVALLAGLVLAWGTSALGRPNVPDLAAPGGDRYADLVVGVPYEDLGGVNEGGVHVLYGSAGG